jgi:hypothetical protein
MDPLVGLRLTDPKQETQYFLGRIQPEINQDEDQPIFDRGQRRFSSAAPPSLPRLAALRFLPLPKSCFGLFKPWQQFAPRPPNSAPSNF